MFECSVCSLFSLVTNFMYNILVYSIEYPMLLFLLSFIIAAVFIAHIHMAKLICTFRSVANCVNLTDNVDYGPVRGPHSWQTSSENQSPINIIENECERLAICEHLIWNHYDDLPTSIMLENTGHTVVLRATYSGNMPTICGADLLASYTFVELCFRWSQLNTEGSEHMLNNRKFPLEIQAMHRTGPPIDPTSSYDLLMVAYFYEISTNNPYLDPIVQNLHRVQKPGYCAEIPPFPLSYLCYQFRNFFYSYGGSLTEPPCNEGAEWFIFPEPLSVSERQLNEFRKLLSRDGRSVIQRNSRPVQCLCASRVVNFNEYNPQAARTRTQNLFDECDPCDRDDDC